MAWTERYANFDLVTGANDGTSEADAWQTISAMTAGVAAGDRVNIKRQSSGYPFTSSVTISNAGTVTAPIWFRAYETAPGDGGMWLVSYNTGGIALLQFTGSYVWVEGLDFQEGSPSNIATVSISGTQSRAIRCRIRNKNGNASIANCYGCDVSIQSTGGHKIGFAGGNAYPIVVTKSLFTVLSTTNGWGFEVDLFNRDVSFIDNVFVGNGTVEGLFIDRADSGRLVTICNNRFYDFTAAIVIDEEPNAGSEQIHIFNNIFDECSTYAVERNNAEFGLVDLYANKYYNAASGFTNYATEAEPIANESLSGSPFVDAAGGDFSLNNTAGAGAVCRIAGFAINEPYDWDNMLEKAVYEGVGSGGSSKHFHISIG